MWRPTVARKSLQTFLVTSTSADGLLLGLPWFLSVGTRMTVMGHAPNVVTLINEGIETSVKADV